MNARARRAPAQLLASALLPALAAACGGGGTSSMLSTFSTSSSTPGPTFDYPLDAEIRFDHLQTKATHSSYHVDTNGGMVLPWAYTQAKLTYQLASQGVRSIEFDVHSRPLMSGAQIISTDYPAPVLANGYVVTIPGGEPSRCNLVTAPPERRAHDVENPAFMTDPKGS
jgi:hypothetical protein